jgi:hypothetical protein
MRHLMRPSRRCGTKILRANIASMRGYATIVLTADQPLEGNALLDYLRHVNCDNGDGGDGQAKGEGAKRRPTPETVDDISRFIH